MTCWVATALAVESAMLPRIVDRFLTMHSLVCTSSQGRSKDLPKEADPES